jgi:hypothetical protein
MKQKFIIAAAVLLLIVVVVFMIRDLFQPSNQQENIYDYSIEEFTTIDSFQIAYVEFIRFAPDIEKPKALAFDDEGMLYVAGKQKVLVYNQELKFVRAFKLPDVAKAIFAKKNQLYISFEHHIEVWSAKGEQKQVWAPYNKQSFIASIAGAHGLVYAADAANKLVLKYNKEGQLLGTIGKEDTVQRKSRFFVPSPYFDVCIGREGQLWVVNPGFHQLEAWNGQGELISTWKRTSMNLDGFSGCCNPSHIALLSDGAFVTAEKGLVRVKVHEPSGDFRSVVAGPADFNKDERGMDVAVNQNDEVFVVVPGAKEVRGYRKR